MHSQPYPTHAHPEPALHLLGDILDRVLSDLRLAADYGPHPAELRAPGRPPALPRLSPGRPLMAGCDVLYYDPTHREPAGHPLGPAGDSWQPCTAPGQAWTDPDLVLRWVCVRHRRQLIALHAAGRADQVRWQRPGLATGPISTREATEPSAEQAPTTAAVAPTSTHTPQAGAEVLTKRAQAERAYAQLSADGAPVSAGQLADAAGLSASSARALVAQFQARPPATVDQNGRRPALADTDRGRRHG